MSEINQTSCDLVIVDDDSVMLDLVCSMIRKCRFSHRGFSDSTSAYEYINQTNPRILLSDYRMPRMDGILLLESLQQSCDMTATATYIFSSVPLPPHIEARALKIGARFLIKDQLFEKGYIESLYYDT